MMQEYLDKIMAFGIVPVCIVWVVGRLQFGDTYIIRLSGPIIALLIISMVGLQIVLNWSEHNKKGVVS